MGHTGLWLHCYIIENLIFAPDESNKSVFVLLFKKQNENRVINKRSFKLLACRTHSPSGSGTLKSREKGEGGRVKI